MPTQTRYQIKTYFQKCAHQRYAFRYIEKKVQLIVQCFSSQQYVDMSKTFNTVSYGTYCFVSQILKTLISHISFFLSRAEGFAVGKHVSPHLGACSLASWKAVAL